MSTFLRKIYWSGLQAGKIYSKERIERVMKNFLAEKNLIRLREMTLSETANYLDRKQSESSDADQPQSRARRRCHQQ
jgi:K+-sensing histidine kinase KdpD